MPLNDIVRNLLVRLTVDAEGASKDIDKASKQFGGLQKNLDGLSRTFTGFGAGLTAGITLPIAGAATAAFKFSTDFNAAMANVATLIPGNVARVNELKGSVQTLAVETGKSTADIAGGLFQVISAFGDSADSVKLLEINARAAAAGLATTEDAINLTSAVTKGYGDTSAAAAQKAADLAFKTNELGQTTFPELAASIGRVVPLSAELKVSQEELFGVMATATGVTGNAAEVSTQLRGVLQSLLAPTADMAKLFEALGIESGKALIEQKGLQGAIETVTSAATASGIPLQKLVSSIEGQTLALALAGPQADVFSQKLAAMQTASGSVDKAFKEQTEGVNALGFTFEQFKTRLEVLAQRLGDTLAPAFKTALDVADGLISAMESGVKFFGELPAPIQTAAIAVAGLAAAVGPVLVGLGVLAGSVSSIIGLLPTLSAAFGTAGVSATTFAGLLTTAKAAVIAMGQAAIVAAAAFAAWELGKWAAENIPLVQKLGDVIVALPLALFGDQLTGVSAAQDQLGKDLEALAKSIKDKFGVEIERGNKSLEEWSKELRKAATELTGAEKKTDAIRDSLKQQTTATVKAEAGVKAFNSAISTLGKETAKADKTIDDIVKSMEKESKQAKLTEAALAIYNRSHVDAKFSNENLQKAAEETNRVLRESERAQQSLARAISGEAVPAMDNAARASASLVISLTNTVPPIANTEQGFHSLSEALGGFGIKSQSVAQNELEVLRQKLEVIRQQAAQGNPDALAALTEAEKKYADAVKAAGGPVEATGFWSDALQQVSTVITDLGKSIAQDLGQHIETGIGFIDSMTEAVLRLVSEKVLGAVLKHFKSLEDFIPSLTNIKGLLKDIGAALGIGSSVASTAGSVAGTAGTAAGAAGQAAGAAGQVAGGVASAGGAAGAAATGGLAAASAVTGIVTGIVSAVTGIIGVFQAARQETTLNAIEENTRRGTLFLGDRGDGGILGVLFRILEEVQFGTFVKVLEQMRDSLGGGVAIASTAQSGPELGFIVGNTDEIKASTWTIRDTLLGIAASGIMIAGGTVTVDGLGRAATGTAPNTPQQLAGGASTGSELDELRRRNPLAFGSENPLASILLGGHNPLTFEPVVTAVETSGMETGLAITDLSSVFRARLDRSNDALTQINTGIQAGAARPLEFHAHFEGATFTDEAHSRRTIDFMFTRARTWGKGIS